MAGRPTYPKREQFFANRFIRLLGKTCVAQEIGGTGFALLVTIAMTEDASRYRRSVTFYDCQLMPIIGVTSQKSLATVRKKAVDAGWLHYEHGSKGKPGRYWVIIPEHAEHIDDNAIDEGHADETDDDQEMRGTFDVNFTANRPRIVRESSANRQQKGQPFLPIPIPIPNTLHTTHATRPIAPNGPSDAFKLFAAIYPRWSGENDAWREWQAAVWTLVSQKGISDEDAEQTLLTAAQRYRDSPAGKNPLSPSDQDFRFVPANWLKGGHYADSDAVLQRPNTRADATRAGSRRAAKPALTRHPDDIDIGELFTKSTSQQAATGGNNHGGHARQSESATPQRLAKDAAARVRDPTPSG